MVVNEYNVIILNKSERYWDDEIYHQRSAKKSRIMEEMKNVAETYKICESSETHTSQNISCMSVAEIGSPVFCDPNTGIPVLLTILE